MSFEHVFVGSKHSGKLLCDLNIRGSNYGPNGPGVRRALRRSAAANTHRLHKLTLLTKLVLPPTLFPNSVGADTGY